MSQDTCDDALIVVSRCAQKVTSKSSQGHLRNGTARGRGRKPTEGGRVVSRRGYREGILYEGKRTLTTVVDKHYRIRYNIGQKRDAVRGEPLQRPKCSAKLPARCEMTRPIRLANGDATSGPMRIPTRAGDGYTSYEETPSRVRGPHDSLALVPFSRTSARSTELAPSGRLSGDSRLHRQQRRLLVSRGD